MKNYIIELAEHYNNTIYNILIENGCEVIFVSDVLPMIGVKTNKTIRELESFYFVESVEEERIGGFN